MPEMKTYHGQCHCGAVKYEAVTDLSGMLDCNCSRCKRMGSVLQSVPEDKFTLLTGQTYLKAYHFNTHQIDHLFCVNCGIESFAQGRDRDGNRAYMINVNCLEDGPDVDRSTIMHWDGRSR